MYNVECRPEASVNDPRRADRSASSASSSLMSGVSGVVMAEYPLDTRSRVPSPSPVRWPAPFSGPALVAVFAFAVIVLSVADRELARSPSTHALRIALWLVGVATLSALTISLIHERRLVRRIAQRSVELERLSAELLRANRAKSEFLANISHELRTPLNAIVGFVDLLRDGVYGELAPRQVSPVQRIEASATHLRHLVDQVLDLAKMTAGRMEVHTEAIDLRPFVTDVTTEIEPLATERGLLLSIAIGPSVPRLRTDPAHLRSILVNLLGNAAKYTTEGGIAVRARAIDPSEPVPDLLRALATAPWIAIQVADSGIGIDPADHGRIFDEFEQVNAGPRGDSARRGTGLGLPISSRLARLLGGTITVESELGKGATFTVWLPVESVDVRPPRVTGAMLSVDAEP
jgi:signal transduction histidine kinase